MRKLLVLILILHTTTTSALECYSNECPHDANPTCTCKTSDHRDSNCFKSAQKTVENNTYVTYYRFGCISGADDNLMGLQCRVTKLKHREPLLMLCCNDADYCNENLPDVDEHEDPRWLDTPIEEAHPDLQSYKLLQYSAILLILALLFVILPTYCFRACQRKRSKTSSQDSIIADDFIERVKSHMVDNRSPPSTHTHTISDDWSHKSDSPCENSYSSYEGTSTLPDLTSGVGTRVLEERTIARNIGSGCMLPVGSGRHGRVFMGEYHYNKVAVKAFRSVDADSWRREESILKKLNHENIIRWIASETVSVSDYVTETWMIIEFCPYGSLCDFLDHFEISSPEQAIKIVHSIIQGINYLHEDLYVCGGKPRVAHRDIKSRNILMKSPDNCCIADFGHSVVKLSDTRLDFGGNDRIQVGTVRYMAPEILQPDELDITQFFTFAQADLYQFALVLWEIAHRTRINSTLPEHRLPYDEVVTQNPDLEAMVKIVCEVKHRPAIPDEWRQDPILNELATLMVECWKPNPKARMETLGVMKKVLDIYNKLQPQPMYHHMLYNNLVDNFTPSFKFDKDQSHSSGGEKTRTTVNMF